MLIEMFIIRYPLDAPLSTYQHYICYPPSVTIADYLWSFHVMSICSVLVVSTDHGPLLDSCHLCPVQWCPVHTVCASNHPVCNVYVTRVLYVSLSVLSR